MLQNNVITAGFTICFASASLLVAQPYWRAGTRVDSSLLTTARCLHTCSEVSTNPTHPDEWSCYAVAGPFCYAGCTLL